MDRKWTFEVGGSSKDTIQISDQKNAFLAVDDLVHPYLNRIPLWLFGFLYDLAHYLKLSPYRIC